MGQLSMTNSTEFGSVLSDNQHEELLHTARAEPLPPGRSAIDHDEFFAALPDEVTIGLEVPMTEMLQREGVEKTLKVIRESMIAYKG